MGRIEDSVRAPLASRLEHARESGTAMVLETGTQRNVPLYERLGFHVVEEAASPVGGPHVWFMRRDLLAGAQGP